MTDDTIRVRIWNGWHDDYSDEPDEVIKVGDGKSHVWQDDPWYHGKVAFDVHPEDAPATVYVRTNDSVREPPNTPSDWGRAIERGLTFDPERYDEHDPFGCEIWGRVLITTEEGGRR